MPTSEGEYDDRCFAVGNIFGGSLVVLRALRKIEIDIPESTDEDDDTDSTSDYANHFFDAFKDSSIFMRSDVDFIYELAENTTRLILDENLNEETLAVQVSKIVVNVS